MKAIFAGGGTGGHLYPALALIKYMKENGLIDDLKYVGGHGIESKIVPAKGIEYIGFDIKGLIRPKRSLGNLKIIFDYYKAAIVLRRLIKGFKPDFIFVTGGYACIPLSMAARWTKTPLFNQEQNVYVGFANRYINRFANVTFTNFEGSLKYFPNKNNVVISGNPVMRKKIDKMEALKVFSLKGTFTVGVFGGSGGSENINDSIREIYEKDDNFNYIHITGERDYSRFKDFKKDNVKILKYCENMDAFYSASDLIVSRAGAMTISELAFMKKPAILVPHPFAAENHQLYNAQFLQDRGVAFVIGDEELNSSILLRYITKARDNIRIMEKNYEIFEYVDSLKIITDKILEVINER